MVGKFKIIYFYKSILFYIKISVKVCKIELWTAYFFPTGKGDRLRHLTKFTSVYPFMGKIHVSLTKVCFIFQEFLIILLSKRGFLVSLCC